MRRVWQIAAKELLQTRRDKLAALFSLILPVIFTVVLGMVIGGAQERGLPLAVADADGSQTAQLLIDRIGESGLVEIRLTDPADVDDAVRTHGVAAGLVIPQGFEASLEAGGPSVLAFVRVETSTGAQSLRQAVSDAVSRLNVSTIAGATAAEQVALATGTTVDEALLQTAGSLVDAGLAAPVVTVDTVESGATDETIAGGFSQSSPGTIVNWVLFSLLGITTTMVWERSQGLLRRLSVAGVRAREVMGGKMLAMLAATFLQQLLLVLLGRLAFDVDYFSSPLALIVTMVSLSLLASTFGLLISSLFRSEQAVVATTVIASMSLAALGGAWFPLEITGGSFSRIAHYLPSAWIMDSFHGITLKGWGIVDILRPMGFVWIWIVALFALAVWRYRPD